MANLTEQHYLNIQSGYMAPVTLHCSYGDSGKEVSFVIFDGSEKLSLDSASVSVHGTRKDGANFGPFSCTTNGNVVTFKIQTSMTAVEGAGIAELAISENGASIGTCNFAILVENAAFPNSVSYDTDPSVYQDILAYVQGLDASNKGDYMARIIAEQDARISGDSALKKSIATESARIDSILDSGTSPEEGELLDIRLKADGTTATSAGNAVREQITELKNVMYTTVTTDNYTVHDESFWNQGRYNDTSIQYIVHSDPFNINDYGALYFGGVCTGTKFSDNACIALRLFDSSETLLGSSGYRVLNETWALSSIDLSAYPTLHHIVIDFTTQKASVYVHPDTFVANYKVYVGHTNISSASGWYDHSKTVSKIDEATKNIIPDYWNGYMEYKANTIRELDGTIGTHGFSFVFVTDIHWEHNRQHSPELINYILEHTSVDTVICGGDILNKNNSISEAMKVINNWAKKTKPLNIINMYGNHDNNSNGGNAESLWIGYDRWYGATLKPIEQKVTWSNDMEYFYIDNPVQKVRMIFTNSGYDQAVAIDSTQASWIQQRLHELTSGWKAIIFQHVVFAPAASGTETLTMAAPGTMTKNMIDSQFSYMSSNNVDFIGVITGHVHRDYSIVTDNGYPIITTTCDAATTQASPYDPVNPTRTAGTTLEQAFDVYHVDTAAKKIYVTRIGAGYDREFTY